MLYLAPRADLESPRRIVGPQPCGMAAWPHRRADYSREPVLYLLLCRLLPTLMSALQLESVGAATIRSASITANLTRRSPGNVVADAR